MSEKTEARWARAVRILALILIAAIATAVLEGNAIRELRGDLQAVRAERELAKEGIAKLWAGQSAEEAGAAIRALDEFYGDPADGLGRRGGLCADNKLNDKAIATSLFETFLPARAAGRTVSQAIDDMRAAVRRTESSRQR